MVAALIERLLIGSANLLVRETDPQTGQGRQSIYIANHASHLDALLLLAALPPDVQRRTRPLAAAEYWNADPLRRYLIRSVRGVLIDREGGSLAPLEPAVSALRARDSLILFPEGTRGPGGALQPLKAGIFHLARAFPNVDLVPVWIDNSHRILPKGAAVPMPARCRIRFGSAMRSPVTESAEEFLVRLRAALEGLRPE